MLSVTQEAKEYMLGKHTSFYIDIPPEVGCCFHVVDTPSIRTGVPHNPDIYEERTFDGVLVYVPKRFPDHNLTISITSFWGLKKLVLEGWHLA